MPSKTPRFCAHTGCPALTTAGYCPEHIAEGETKRQEQFKRYDKRRGSAADRGYGARWDNASKGFLRQPGNQICKLHLQGCTLIATCTDHIDPPDGPNDPRFWDKRNWQASCVHCNSVKGHTKIVGEYDMMDDLANGPGRTGNCKG